MSSTGLQVATAAGEGPDPANPRLMDSLLHALSQPVTGLQCAMELAAAKPLAVDQYRRVLRESLEMVGRIRFLIKAIQEVNRQHGSAKRAELEVHSLIRQTVGDLMPVAEAHNVRLCVECAPGVIVETDPTVFQRAIFRLLEVGISRGCAGTELRIRSFRNSDQLLLKFTWEELAPCEPRPLSLTDTGLLVAEAELKCAGATFEHSVVGNLQTSIVRVSLPRPAMPSSPGSENSR